MCADHARLIDTNKGRGYAAPLLRGWRQLHEAFLVYEMRGLVPPCTLITEINVRQGPEALRTRPIALSALNIFTGTNSTGKTTLLNLLARAGHKQPFTDYPWYGDPCRLADDRIRGSEPQRRLQQGGRRTQSVPQLGRPQRVPLTPGWIPLSARSWARMTHHGPFLITGLSAPGAVLTHRHLDRHGDGWQAMRDAVGSGWDLTRFAEAAARH